MAVKRKTENVDLEQALENQIPEFTEPAVETQDEHDKIEAEIRARVEAEVKRREEERNSKQPQETTIEEKPTNQYSGKLGQKLTHVFQGKDENFKEYDEQLVKDKKLSRLGDNILKNVEIRDGWIPMDKNILGERALYYPESWEFLIRPATVDAIRNWSTVDEENPFNTSAVLNEILKHCLSINTPHGKRPWSEINLWDKMAFILLIRAYTFQQGEQAIVINEECANCESPVEFRLDAQSLIFELPDNEVLKYYDRENRQWHIDPQEFGVSYDPITLYNPTVEKDANLTQYIVDRVQENRNYKPEGNFLKFLMWLAPKISKDSTIAKRQIKEYQNIYKSWDIDMFTFMEDVIRNISVTQTQNLVTVCPSCGEEVTTQARFPDGIRELFTIRSKFKGFGPK